MPDETKETNPGPDSKITPTGPAEAAAAPAEPAKAAAASAGEMTGPSPAAPKPPIPPVVKPAPPKPEAPKPEPWESALVRALRSQYGSGIEEANTYLGQNCLVVDNSIVYEVLLRIHDEGFDYCVDITAVHYPKRALPFDVVYILYAFHSNQRLRVKTRIADGHALHTACRIWPTANWLEREIYDMFGIVFDGHPELKRILMPDEWKGYPLRKDYPILQQDQEWVHINLGIESAQ